MLTKLDFRPECLEHLDMDYEFFKITPDEDETHIPAYFAAFVSPTHEMFIHIELVVPFTKSVLGLLKKTWEEILDMARFFDVKSMVAVGDPMNEKWPKFLAHFGFDEPKVYAITTQEVPNGKKSSKISGEDS